MSIPATYQGMPVKIATPELIREAVMIGRRLTETEEWAAYALRDMIVFVDRQLRKD